MNSLNAVSPIDGRYRGKCEPLARYFSEGALIKYRVRVEVEYFIALADALSGQRPQLACVADRAEALRDIYWFRQTWPSEKDKYAEQYKKLVADPEAKAEAAALLKAAKKRK